MTTNYCSTKRSEYPYCAFQIWNLHSTVWIFTSFCVTVICCHNTLTQTCFSTGALDPYSSFKFYFFLLLFIIYLLLLGRRQLPMCPGGDQHPNEITHTHKTYSKQLDRQ